MVEIDQKPTMFGRFRKNVRTITAKNQTADSFVDRHDESAVEAYASEAASASTAPTASAGTVVEIDQKPTMFGRFRKVTRTRTAKNQASTEWRKTLGRAVATVSATHSTAETEPSTPAAGTVVTVRQRPTPFGDVAKEVETQVAAKVDGSWRTYDTPDGTAGELDIINASASDFAAVQSTLSTRSTAGDSTRLSYSVGEDGLYRISASYRPASFSASGTSWGAQSDETIEYPSFTDENERTWRAMKVHLYFNTTSASAHNDWRTAATSGYTNVPSYRGVASGANREGIGRWKTVRVEVSNT